MARAQAHYKREFEACLREERTAEIKVGDFVFLHNKYFSPETKKRNKLSPVAECPSKCISVSTDTVVLEIGDAHECLSLDCVIIALTRPTEAARAVLDPTPASACSPVTLVMT